MVVVYNMNRVYYRKVCTIKAHLILRDIDVVTYTLSLRQTDERTCRPGCKNSTLTPVGLVFRVVFVTTSCFTFHFLLHFQK